jgi:RHS repeat-associated protein
LEGSVGLYDYPLRGPLLRSGNARMYSPLLARFISADTIVPDPANPQALNRSAYVLNNPLRYTDPSGHKPQQQGDPRCLRINCKPYIEGGGNIVFNPAFGGICQLRRAKIHSAIATIARAQIGQCAAAAGSSPSSFTTFNNSLDAGLCIRELRIKRPLR